MSDILKELLDNKTPESETVDYKEIVPDDIGKDIAAMANTDGGHIVIGVEDDDGVPGNVRGLVSTDHAAHLSVEARQSRDWPAQYGAVPRRYLHRCES